MITTKVGISELLSLTSSTAKKKDECVAVLAKDKSDAIRLQKNLIDVLSSLNLVFGYRKEDFLIYKPVAIFKSKELDNNDELFEEVVSRVSSDETVLVCEEV